MYANRIKRFRLYTYGLNYANEARFVQNLLHKNNILFFAYTTVLPETI
jgi:hypothetical protein